jgi:hypothetical protein
MLDAGSGGWLASLRSILNVNNANLSNAVVDPICKDILIDQHVLNIAPCVILKAVVAPREWIARKLSCQCEYLTCRERGN